jgi:putative ABC transport system permease protein
MLKNFLLIATRNFLRQRFYSFINVFGLATGLASALFIFLWVNDELSIDARYKDSDRLYQVLGNMNMTGGDLLTWSSSPGPMREAILETVPEAEVVVQVFRTGSQLLKNGEKSIMERGNYVDSTFFRIFSFKIAKGTTANLDRSSIVISEKLATTLFGDEDPIGKVVEVSGKHNLEVKAVFEDLKRGTSLRFEYLLPMEVYKSERGDGWNWGNYDPELYIKLHEGASIESATKKINEIEDARVRVIEAGAEKYATFFLMPLKDAYLNSHFTNGVPDGGRILFVRIFSVVAIFIVLIACINFMNMATARAVQRAKEVGVRKVVGAQRESLVWQFLGESIITTLLSMLCALSLVFMLLPIFNSIVSKNIVFNPGDPWLLISCLLIVLVTGLIAGSYPAFFLSSYKPAAVLKGTASPGLRGAALRKGLVTFQFALTVIMVASALVVLKQIDFIRSKDIGYDRNSLINFSANDNVLNRFEAFKTEAEKIPGIEMVSRSDNSLVQVENQNRSVTWPGRPDDDNTFFRTVVVDYQYLEAMGVKLKEGRMFNAGFADTSSYIVTQSAVDAMGLENPVGTQITQWGHAGKIIGVAENIHSRSMHEAIDPLVFMMIQKGWQIGRIVVRFDVAKTQDVIAGLEKLTRQFAPDYPFQYTFVDEDFERLYSMDKVTGSLALGFTVIAIIISGLGLLALAAYTAERKKKEISIRKTLGASVGGIVTIMARDFAKLSLIAAVIGCPVAWYLMGMFLEGYQYHIDLSVGVFVITALAVVFISVITVIFQVAKAAVANPVDALRNE